jgi:Holliday junction resolvase RusA-like endonuclease
MILLILEPPKIWSWKSHQGFGKKSFNPLYKEREYVQYHIRKQYTENLLACAVRITYDFFFTPPKNLSKKRRQAMICGEIKHTIRPDATNMIKFWEDCLKGIVIEDDSLAYKNEAEKHYAEKCQVIIKIYPWESSS